MPRSAPPTSRSLDRAIETASRLDDHAEGVMLWRAGVALHRAGEVKRSASMMSRAFGLALTSSNEANRTHLLNDIAHGQNLVGDRAGALETLTSVWASFHDLPPADRVEALLANAGFQSINDDIGTLDTLDVARRLLPAVPEKQREMLTAEVAAALAENGKFAAAMELAASIKSREPVDIAAAGIASGQARAGKFAEAETTIKTIQDRERRDYAAAQLVEGLAGSGQLKDVSRIASTIEPGDLRADAYREIGKALFAAGNIAAGQSAIDRAIGATSNPSHQQMIAIDGVRWRAEAGDLEGAKRLVEAFEPPTLRSIASTYIAAAAAAGGDMTPANAAAREQRSVAGRSLLRSAVARALARNAGLDSPMLRKWLQDETDPAIRATAATLAVEAVIGGDLLLRGL